MKIYLAICHPDGNEFHIHWKEHANLGSAEVELDALRTKLLLNNKYPMDAFVYQADKPPYGYQEYRLDEMDFNFYREKTPEEIAQADAKFKDTMSKLKVLADKEAADEKKAKATKNA